MNVCYRVELSQVERGELKALRGGKHASRRLKRAQILRAADAGGSDEEIARSAGVSGSTVYRTKRRFVEGNLERALSEEPRPRAERKLTGKEEALLAGALVKLTEHKGLSRETVRRRLAENDLKPWRRDMWCIPQLDGEYVARMEDVLDLHAEAPDPSRPVVCVDESPAQLIGEVTDSAKARPARTLRLRISSQWDGQSLRSPRRASPLAEDQAHRAAKAKDYAQCMRNLVDIHYPDAEIIRMVQDNLSTHSAGALYQVFPPAEARRILRRIEFHYTPKHASWLNMVEIEIGVLRGQCLAQRIDHPKRWAAKSPPGNASSVTPWIPDDWY